MATKGFSHKCGAVFKVQFGERRGLGSVVARRCGQGSDRGHSVSSGEILSPEQSRATGMGDAAHGTHVQSIIGETRVV